MVELYEHNLEAFGEIKKMIESGTKKIAVPRATGSGKSFLMGALAERYNNDKKLVLEPTRPLLDNIKEKFDEFGIANTDFMTYQKLIRLNNEEIACMDYKLIFLDECHHGTAPVWGQRINYLMETHSDSIIFGTSATTVRNDGVNVVESLFEGNAVGELSLSTAIARKVLPCPHYITAIYRLDDEFEKLKKRIENSTNDKAEKQEFYEKMKIMKTHFEKSYGIPTILNKYVKEKNGRYLVFCKDRKHLDTMRDVVADWFRTAGIKDVHSYAVYSDYPDKEKDYKDFCEDNSDSAKILFSINMLNEGVHVKDISGVLMLRTTQSNRIYLQQLGRLVDADNIGKYLLVFDFVNNFSSVSGGIGLLKEIKDAVEREKDSDPDFDDSEFADIDTFFVLENVIEIQEMFRGIEGRLAGSWDLYIKALKQYKEREGDCLVPDDYVEVVNEEKVGLGNWCQNMRNAKKGKGRWLLTLERINELEKMGFVWNCEKRFDRFIRMVEIYREKFGHTNIKVNDIIDGYSIGNYYSSLYKEYRIGVIKESNIRRLKRVGIDITVNRLEKYFQNKIQLVKKAVNEGIVINNGNRCYMGINLYIWINGTVKKRYLNNELASDEICVIERLINKPIYQMFNNGEKFIKVIDLVQNCEIEIYSSQKETIKIMREKYNVNINTGDIYKRTNDKTSTPYKGRFMFYYATDEEVKKYLEENRTN